MRLLHLSTRAPWVVLLAVLTVTLLAGRFAVGIRIDSSVDSLLPKQDEARTYYEGVRERFGSEEVTVLGVFAADVFAPSTLEKIAGLSTSLAALPGVREVLSLTTARGAVSVGGALRTGRLLESGPFTTEAAEALRERVRAIDLYDRILVGQDDRSTAINVFYEPMSDRALLDSGLDRAMERLLEEAGGPEEFAIAGMPRLKAQAADLIRRDLVLFVPASALFVALVLAWAFRSPRGVLLPMGTVLIGLVSPAGFAVAMGSAITFGTLIVAPLVIAVGSAYAIHIMNQYNRFATPTATARAVTEEALDDVWVPLTVAGLTTLIGFLTFLTNAIPTIREFGLFAGFGVFSVIVLSFTFMPAAIAVLPVHVPPSPAGTQPGRLERLLDWIGDVGSRRTNAVLGVFGLLTVLSGLGILQLRVETDYLAFFQPNGPVRTDAARISHDLAGTQPVSVVVESHAKRGLLRPEVFAGMVALQAFLDAQPEVEKTLSFVDHLTHVKRALVEDAAAPPPASAAEASQVLMLLDPAKLSDVVTPDFERGVILVRTKHEGSAALRRLIERVEAAAAQKLPKGIDAHVTGSTVLINRSADEIAIGQAAGLAQALLALLIVLSVLFLSVRVGAVALLPNLFPIVVLFGIMGWSGVSLNLSTSLIATIAIGIAIDDTIHFLSHFNAVLRESADQAHAARVTLRTIGPAMVFTSVALAIGFGVIGFSGFVPIQHFGILASVTMLVALASDLFLTPALMQRVRLVTLWEVLRLRLGPDGHEAIRMFAGLRPTQARIVVLMSRLATAEPGAFLTKRGEMGAELFLLLSGRAEVLGPGGVPVHTLGRGDVVGEMGALRQAPRSADVVVREPTEYLMVDEAFLERLRRRYPRTAAVVLLNLARILSDRLEQTTAGLSSEQPARTTG
jgi:predicted RND superfamily exporter protein